MRKRLHLALLILLGVAVVAGGYFLFFHQRSYTPPPFEPSAQAGEPSPAQSMGYGRIEADGGFAFSVAGTMYQQADASLLIYLTNHEDGDVWLMGEVVDENGTTLYKSGILRPGEYVERLFPVIGFANEAMKIELRVYGFEPETYYSLGTIFLDNILQPW